MLSLIFCVYSLAAALVAVSAQVTHESSAGEISPRAWEQTVPCLQALDNVLDDNTEDNPTLKADRRPLRRTPPNLRGHTLIQVHENQARAAVLGEIIFTGGLGPCIGMVAVDTKPERDAYAAVVGHKLADRDDAWDEFESNYEGADFEAPASALVLPIPGTVHTSRLYAARPQAVRDAAERHLATQNALAVGRMAQLVGSHPQLYWHALLDYQYIYVDERALMTTGPGRPPAIAHLLGR